MPKYINQYYNTPLKISNLFTYAKLKNLLHAKILKII